LAPSGKRPPIWVGGNSKPALRRAARYEGWAPFHTAGFAKFSRTAAIETIDELRAAIATVRRLRPDSRSEQGFDVCWSENLVGNSIRSADERCARVAELEAAGVTWLAVSVPGATRPELLEGVASFGRDVIGGMPGAPSCAGHTVNRALERP
jgi:hypothetical protein